MAQQQDWFRIMGIFAPIIKPLIPDGIFCLRPTTYLPVSIACQIIQVDNYTEMTQFVVKRGTTLDSNTAVKETTNFTEKLLPLFAGNTLFPMYFMYTRQTSHVFPGSHITKSEEGIWCIVHPTERERMERYLNGTANPMYDLVHELRYNPGVLGVGAEKKEAQNDFHNNIKK